MTVSLDRTAELTGYVTRQSIVSRSSLANVRHDTQGAARTIRLSGNISGIRIIASRGPGVGGPTAPPTP